MTGEKFLPSLFWLGAQGAERSGAKAAAEGQNSLNAGRSAASIERLSCHHFHCSV